MQAIAFIDLFLDRVNHQKLCTPLLCELNGAVQGPIASMTEIGGQQNAVGRIRTGHGVFLLATCELYSFFSKPTCARSEERRVGKACVTCRVRGWPYL